MLPSGSLVIPLAHASLVLAPTTYWKLSTVCQFCAGAAWMSRPSTAAAARGKKGALRCLRPTPPWQGGVRPLCVFGSARRGAAWLLDTRHPAFVFLFVFIIIMFGCSFCFNYKCAKQGGKRIRGAKVLWGE